MGDKGLRARLLITASCVSAGMGALESITDLRVYNTAMKLGHRVWVHFGKCNAFDQKVLATQFIRAADSIAANIAEGFGRFTYRDRIRFLYIARGSLQECFTWLAKARNREYINGDHFDTLEKELAVLQRMLNSYITSMKEKTR